MPNPATPLSYIYDGVNPPIQTGGKVNVTPVEVSSDYEFDTYQDMVDAIENGDVDPGSTIYVKEDQNTVLIDADSVAYGNGTVKDALDSAIELLWSNPDPSVAFAAQTISLDLSTYRFVDISFNSYAPVTRFEIGRGYIYLRFPTATGSTNVYRFFDRGISATTNGVICTDASMYTSGTSGSTVGNTLLTPVNIWGIK